MDVKQQTNKHIANHHVHLFTLHHIQLYSTNNGCGYDLKCKQIYRHFEPLFVVDQNVMEFFRNCLICYCYRQISRD